VLGFWLTIVSLFVLVPGAVMVVLGVRMTRRSSAVPRVPIEAVVVDFTNFTRPSRVTFDYPAPDGTWLRATRVCGLVSIRRRGWFVAPGDRLTVYVNPASPLDVSLGDVGGVRSLGGIALILAGSMFGLFGIAQVVLMAVTRAR